MPYQEIKEEEKIDLISVIEKMIKNLKRYGKIILLFVMAGMVFNVGYTMLTHTPVYASEAMFIVSTANGKNIYSVNEGSEELNSRFSTMISSEYMQKIIMED